MLDDSCLDNKKRLNQNENENFGSASFFVHFQQAKIFIGTDSSNKYINELYNKYNNMIKRVTRNGYFTAEDLDIYKEVGKFMSHEKSKHDTRNFDETIIPYFLISILE